MTISKDALEYVVGLGTNRLEEIGGQTFSTQPLHLVKEPVAAPIALRSLSGMVEYLKSKFDGDTKLLVHVVSPTEVVAFGTYNHDLNRSQAVKATALLPEFTYGRYYGTEEFIISLQAMFVPYGDRDILLKIVGNVKEESVQAYGDDGVSQSVTAKTGIASVETTKVPNPVVLMPFRTFVEVGQPESEFVFRMKSGPSSALIEADGGAWKLEAMQNVKLFLESQLTDEIATGRIVIIA